MQDIQYTKNTYMLLWLRKIEQYGLDQFSTRTVSHCAKHQVRDQNGEQQQVR